MRVKVWEKDSERIDKWVEMMMTMMVIGRIFVDVENRNKTNDEQTWYKYTYDNRSMYIYTDDKFEILEGGGSKKQEQKTRFEAAFFVLVKTIFLYIDDYRYCF